MTTKSVCMWTNCKKTKPTYVWRRPEFLQPYTVHTLSSVGLCTLYTLNVDLTCGRSHPSGPGLSSWMWRSGSPGPDLLRPESGPFYLGEAGKTQNTENTWSWSASTSIHINSLSLWGSLDIIHPLESSTCTGLKNINVLTGALYWNHLEVIFLRGPRQPSSPPGLLHPRNLPEGISNMIIRDS